MPTTVDIQLGPVLAVTADLLALVRDVSDELPIGHEAKRKLLRRRKRLVKIVREEIGKADAT